MCGTTSHLRFVIALLIAPGGLAAQTPGDTSEEAAVRAVVERYLHGLKFNDTTSLHNAFWPEARLFYVKSDGQIGQWTQASWYATFATSAGKEEQGELRIAAVDVTRDIATAKVIEDYSRSRYTDYISLLRIQGRWWIVNKIYTAERR
jgi:hypothetical protein